MFEMLEGYLDTFTTPESGTLILNAAKLLYDQGLENHLFQIQNLIYEAEHNDSTAGVDEIQNLLETHVVAALRQMGVWPADESELSDLYKIYRGLTMIENFEDQSSLSIALESDEDNTDVLADILHLVTGIKPEEYLPHLDQVRPELIERIRDITPNVEDGDVIDPIIVAGVQGRLRQFVAENPIDKSSLFYQALEDGLHLGTSFDLLMSQYLQDILSLAPSKMARELVCFGLASSLPNDQIEGNLKSVRETATVSVIEMMEIDRDVRNYLSGVLRA